MKMTDELHVYDQEEVQARLARELSEWRLENGRLSRRFKTADWQATVLLANAIAYLAEAADHHPDLELSWGKLGVKLQTHKAGGITDKDFALAHRIEDIVAKES
jgi:4a-hydroxytetrahydrobiopterin dehydratase